MALSKEAKAKSVFVSPLGRFELCQCPFGLAQASAYFQQMVYELLRGHKCASVIWLHTNIQFSCGN